MNHYHSCMFVAMPFFVMVETFKIFLTVITWNVQNSVCHLGAGDQLLVIPDFSLSQHLVPSCKALIANFLIQKNFPHFWNVISCMIISIGIIIVFIMHAEK